MTRPAILVVTAMALGLFGICAPAVIPTAPRLIWNATASTPVGLYALRPAGRLRVTELVAVQPPAPVARYLAAGGFLPIGALLLKHIAALPEQTVCRTGDVITVDGVTAGDAHDRDHLGRPLPRWRGCRTLQPDQVFLMNPAVPDSLDGRYFGPFPATSIVARAVPIWTAEADDGRFVWRAVPR
jgi:conjugative transfer signal peptidase TraF